MAVEVYRPGQGLYARIGTGAALLVLALFSAVRLYNIIPAGERLPVLGLQIPMSVIWSGVVFVVEAAVIMYFLAGPDFGGKWLRKRARKFVDLLVETQQELQKVVWPTRDDLVSNTVVVLITVVLLGVFVFLVDVVVLRLMILLKVLPEAGG